MEINKVVKLVANLHDKKNYIIHIRALDQALKHGLVIEKIHQAIEFDQSAWLKTYIDSNTQLRTWAKNDFKKDFFEKHQKALGYQAGNQHKVVPQIHTETQL